MNALFIFNSKGDILMSKFFREGVKRNVSDVFRIQVINSAARISPEGNPNARDVRLPVLTLGSTSFMYIRSGFLWVVAVTRSNQDLLVVFEYLLNLVALLKLAFAKPLAEALCEDDIVANFTTIFDILDELVDFGFPISLEPSYLTSVVPSLAGLKINVDGSRRGSAEKKNAKQNLESAYDPNSISWRDQGIKYRKNEIYLNVEEKLHVLLTARGASVRSYIDGAIQMKSHLSGMPICRFGFSDERSLENILDSITLDDFKFHQCVELAKYDVDQVIRFVPPDGTFQLMTYHVANSSNLPFKVISTLREDGDKLSLKIRLISQYSSKLSATNVVLKVPTPTGVTRNLITCSNGKAKYIPEDKVIQWKFNRLYGESEHDLAIDLGTQHNIGWSKPTITLDFTLEMFSASGLAVKFLKVMEKSNYRTMKWIKYTTQAGSYEIRL